VLVTSKEGKAFEADHTKWGLGTPDVIRRQTKKVTWGGEVINKPKKKR